MTGLILAGGKGTRLHPHTEELPKPLLEINGKAILGYQIETLSTQGISPIVIVTGFLSEKIQDYVHENYADKDVLFAHNADFEHSKPAYGIISALPHLNTDVIYLNGDVFYDPKILSAVINSKHSSATAIQKSVWDEEEVNVILDADMLVTHISKNITAEQSHGEFIGVTKLSRDFVEEIKTVVATEGVETFRYSFAIDLLNHIINTRDKKLFAIDITEFQAIEIDTIEDYNEAIKKQGIIGSSYEKTD